MLVAVITLPIVTLYTTDMGYLLRRMRGLQSEENIAFSNKLRALLPQGNQSAPVPIQALQDGEWDYVCPILPGGGLKYALQDDLHIDGRKYNIENYDKTFGRGDRFWGVIFINERDKHILFREFDTQQFSLHITKNKCGRYVSAQLAPVLVNWPYADVNLTLKGEWVEPLSPTKD